MAEPIVLETPTGELFGTLEVPVSPDAPVVVLIIAGSGPTDRDGNSPLLPGANNSLRYLAEELAAQGIASLRYDKRGIAASAKACASESDLRFETYIDDAILWGRFLERDGRFGTLVVLGHSEGSLIGMVAARKLEADAFVSVAGIGRPAAQVVLDQLKDKLPADLLAQTHVIVQSLVEGKTTDAVPVALNALFRPAVQPYEISWFRYHPTEEIAQLSMPTLIAQGTTDIQVAVEEARLLSRANPSAELLVIEGMNHVLKEVPADQQQQIQAYSDPALPVAPPLIAGICRFIRSIRQ